MEGHIFSCYIYSVNDGLYCVIYIILLIVPEFNYLPLSVSYRGVKLSKKSLACFPYRLKHRCCILFACENSTVAFLKENIEH